jgi:hypothetical protein
MTPKHATESARAAAVPTIGCDVYTIEGLPAGKVAALSGRFMRVDAPMRRDYWLHVEDIVSDEGGAVTLAYPRDAVEEHRHNAPVASESDVVFDDGVPPVLLAEEEQLEQRARMERELDEQRRHLAERAAPVEQKPAGSPRPRLARCLPCFVGAAALAVFVLAVRRRRRRARRHPADAVPEA